MLPGDDGTLATRQDVLINEAACIATLTPTSSTEQALSTIADAHFTLSLIEGRPAREAFLLTGDDRAVACQQSLEFVAATLSTAARIIDPQLYSQAVVAAVRGFKILVEFRAMALWPDRLLACSINISRRSFYCD